MPISSGVVEEHDPRQAARKLGEHSLWAGAAFCIIILVAVGLEWFAKGLILAGLIDKDGVLDWTCRIGGYLLAAAFDLTLLVGVVGKQGWRLFKAF